MNTNNDPKPAAHAATDTTKPIPDSRPKFECDNFAELVDGACAMRLDDGAPALDATVRLDACRLDAVRFEPVAKGGE